MGGKDIANIVNITDIKNVLGYVLRVVITLHFVVF